MWNKRKHKYLVTYVTENGGYGSCETHAKKPLGPGDKEKIETDLTEKNGVKSVITQITKLN